MQSTKWAITGKVSYSFRISWHMPIIAALRKLKQDCKFEVSLNSTPRLSFKTTKNLKTSKTK